MATKANIEKVLAKLPEQNRAYAIFNFVKASMKVNRKQIAWALDYFIELVNDGGDGFADDAAMLAEKLGKPDVAKKMYAKSVPYHVYWNHYSEAAEAARKAGMPRKAKLYSNLNDLLGR